MAVTYKDIDAYTKKASVAGDEKIPVSSSEYITPDQIRATPVASTQPAGGFLPNVVYDLGTLTGTVTFSLAAASDATKANAYFWTFETSSTAPTITWPSNITWAGGSAPAVSAGKHYEIMIRNGYGTFIEI